MNNRRKQISLLPEFCAVAGQLLSKPCITATDLLAIHELMISGFDDFRVIYFIRGGMMKTLSEITSIIQVAEPFPLVISDSTPFTVLVSLESALPPDFKFTAIALHAAIVSNWSDTAGSVKMETQAIPDSSIFFNLASENAKCGP